MNISAITIDSIESNINTISQLQPGQKLRVMENHFNIRTNTWSWEYLTWDLLDKTLFSKCHELLENLLCSSNDIIEEQEHVFNANPTTMDQGLLTRLKNIWLQAIEKGKGLDILQESYAAKPEHQQRIHDIIKSIDLVISRIETLFSRIPVQAPMELSSAEALEIPPIEIDKGSNQASTPPNLVETELLKTALTLQTDLTDEPGEIVEASPDTLIEEVGEENFDFDMFELEENMLDSEEDSLEAEEKENSLNDNQGLLEPEKSKDKPAEKKFNTAMDGINLEGECPNDGKKVVIPYGFTTINIAKNIHRSKCPCCEKNAVKVWNVIFKNCRWQFEGIDKNRVVSIVQGSDHKQVNLWDWKYVELKTIEKLAG